MKPTLVIWNPRASRAPRAQELRESLERDDSVRLVVLEEGTSLAEVLLAEPAQCVVAAGGDGTVRGVAIALDDGKQRDRILGVLPLGTGNDFARSLGVPLDPTDAWACLRSERMRVRPLDMAMAFAGGSKHRFMNVAAGGNSLRVARATADESKRRWGVWSYLGTALTQMTDLVSHELAVRFDEGPTEHFEVVNVIVANGRRTSGGLEVAPRADLRDGLLDIALVLHGTLTDYAALAARLLAGTLSDGERIVYRQAARVELDAQPELCFSLDGEILDHAPSAFRVEPRAIQVLQVDPSPAAAPEQ
ncbi:MAG: YegS/Rv2252/BmrU family lipid kinase [Planctomycetes bacterium]|nr:YegS/Rv2252/BmrU family lipid kinase [Planctomycetota bacterium]